MAVRRARSALIKFALKTGIVFFLLLTFVNFYIPLLTTERSRTLMGYPESFQYLLNSDLCSRDAHPVQAVIVVHSDPRHPELRDAIRESLPQEFLSTLGLRRAFMLGDATQAFKENETTIAQRLIEAESRRHRDIVQGNFHDSYHNLTYKHIMALEWANTYCSRARLIVKMDDDIVYDVYVLLSLLRKTPTTKYLGGEDFQHSKPYRLGSKKWSVSYDYWPREYFPPYVSGWLYIMTHDISRHVVIQSTKMPFFWIDDTFVTGILAEPFNVTVSSLRRVIVTNEDCLKYTTDQRFDLERRSTSVVYRPSFAIGPSGKDLQVLRKFNELTRYCRKYICQNRARFERCKNSL